MRASLEIAVNAQHSFRMKYQLYYFLLLTEAAPYGNSITLDDFRTYLAARGTTPATIKRAIHALQQPFGKDGKTTALVRTAHNTIRPVSIASIAEGIGLKHLGWVTFTDNDMATYETFKPALFDVTAFGARRDVRGGVTGSQEGFKKFTGLSVSTQRNYRRRRSIRAQENYAIIQGVPCDEKVVPETGEVVLVPDRSVLIRRYGPGRMRPDIHRHAVRKANTYFSSVAATSQMAQTYTGASGIPAKNQRVLQPEYGVRTMRQNFERGMVETGLAMCDILETGCDADIFHHILHTKTGKTVGIYHRYMGDLPVEFDESDRRGPTAFQLMNFSITMR